jgi:hypothetical protein
MENPPSGRLPEVFCVCYNIGKLFFERNFNLYPFAWEAVHHSSNIGTLRQKK